MTKLIHVYLWQLTPNILLKAYMANWCKPCLKIKPEIMKMMQINKLIKVTTMYSTNEDKPDKIPFFQLLDHNLDIIKSIQTSDKHILFEFIESSFN